MLQRSMDCQPPNFERNANYSRRLETWKRVFAFRFQRLEPKWLGDVLQDVSIIGMQGNEYDVPLALTMVNYV
jgi:hypothetical protein